TRSFATSWQSADLGQARVGACVRQYRLRQRSSLFDSGPAAATSLRVGQRRGSAEAPQLELTLRPAAAQATSEGNWRAVAVRSTDSPSAPNFATLRSIVIGRKMHHPRQSRSGARA